MIILFLGYRTHNRNEVPDVLFIGNDAEKGLQTVAEKAKSYVRVGKLVNPETFPVEIPETPAVRQARIDREAEEQKNRELTAREALKTSATAAIEKAKREIAEAETALKNLEANPEDPAAQRNAKLQQLEADLAQAEADFTAADSNTAKKKAEKAFAKVKAALDEFNKAS